VALASDEPIRARTQARSAPALRDSDVNVCLIDAGTYLRERGTWVAIDARSSAARKDVRIPGALEIDPAQLSRKSFLKQSRPILVGSGLDTPDLVERCVALRAEGAAEAQVLTGGVRALYRAGESLAGSARAVADLDWVSPPELHRLLLRAPREVIVAGVEAQVPSFLDGARRVAVRDWSELAATLRKTSETGMAIVAVTATPESARKLHDALAAEHAVNVFVLREGLPSYVAYLDEQKRIAATTNVKLVRPCGPS
jgi:hypothetical protein